MKSLFILVQWEQNDGNCGVCGDAYHLRWPRPHEAGGEYGKGIISRRYASGQVINFILFYYAEEAGNFLVTLKILQEIDVEIELTANHYGRFEM